jgi:hypothetical protein
MIHANLCVLEKDEGRRFPLPLELAQSPEFVPSQGTGARRPVLDPSDVQDGGAELDLVPALSVSASGRMESPT